MIQEPVFRDISRLFRLFCIHQENKNFKHFKFLSTILIFACRNTVQLLKVEHTLKKGLCVSAVRIVVFKRRYV